MNPYIILPVLAFLINFFMMSYAMALNIRNPVNRSYVMLSAVISLWVLCSAAFHLPLEDAAIVPFSKFSSIFWYLTGFFFTNFTYLFLRRQRDLFYYSILAISLTAIITATTTDLIISGFTRYDWGWRFNEGVLFSLVTVIAIVMPIIVSWALAFRHRQSTGDPVRRRQIAPLLAGVLISLLFSGINQFIIPNLTGLENSVRYTASWSVILSLFVFYTTTRYRFLTPEIHDIADELFASSREGVVILNSSGSVLNMNDAAMKILHVGDAMTASLRIETLVDKYSAEHSFSNYMTTTSHPGWKRTILLNQSVIRAGDMTIGRILIINDITEMARMNEALRESNELFKLITNNVKDVIWIFDLALLKFSYVSPSVTASTGWSPGEFTSLTLSDLLDGDDVRTLTAILGDEIASDGMRDQGRSRSHTLKERSKNGAMIDIEINTSFIRDTTGKPVAILGVTRDITVQKRLENELRTSVLQLKERNESIEKDLKTAQVVQRALLPAEAPSCERLAIGFRYNTPEAIGGDFFNIQPLAEGGLSIFVSDVTGHGITAALFLSLLKSISTAHLRRYASEPKDYLAALNADLYKNMHTYFVSAVYGFFHCGGIEDIMRLTVSCAGHPAPIIHPSGGGPARYLDIQGKVIGLMRDTSFQSLELPLNTGDRVYFYTDGLPEMTDAGHEYLGYGRFLEIIGGTGALSLNEALDSIIAAANRFRCDEPITDDLVIIGVEVL